MSVLLYISFFQQVTTSAIRTKQAQLVACRIIHDIYVYIYICLYLYL